MQLMNPRARAEAGRVITCCCVAAAVALCGPLSADAQRVVLGFQGFETNSPSSTVLDELAVGVLSNGQQLLELVDSNEMFVSEIIPEGSVIRDFIQPSETFDPINPTSPLPSQPTGRVYDATDGSVPWTLRWANTRVPPGIFEEIAQQLEDEANAFLASQGFPPNAEFIFVGDPDEVIPGPVPNEDNFDGVIFNATANTFPPFNLGSINGVTEDNFDAIGVATQERFDSEGSFQQQTAITEGDQALLIHDADGAILLDLDPVDVTGHSGLELSFTLAVGETGYEGQDRFAVVANGVTVLEFDPPANPDDDNELNDAPITFTPITVDLASIGASDTLELRFVFDSSSGAESFGLDSILITGVPENAGPAGDYNDDGVVDGVDYAIWRESLGATVPAGSGPDGSGDGLVNDADLVIWRTGFGAGTASATGAAASPEPTTAALLAVFASVLGRRRPHRQRG